jgi:hypothetical protein
LYITVTQKRKILYINQYTVYNFPMRPLDKNSPYSTPIPIRFSDKQLAEIEAVAKEFEMSRAEIIRLSCSAGLVALKKLTPQGLTAAVARLLTEG